jgi:hypothetical protein
MILTIKKKLQKSKDDSVLGSSACEVSTWQIQGSFVSFAISHVVVLHQSPTFLHASQKRDSVMGPPPPPPKWAGGGAGRTGKSAYVEWRREQKILALTFRGGRAVQDVRQPHLHKFYQQI